MFRIALTINDELFYYKHRDCHRNDVFLILSFDQLSKVSPQDTTKRYTRFKLNARVERQARVLKVVCDNLIKRNQCNTKVKIEIQECK